MPSSSSILLLDQQAVPTFVEVKRSTDTRIRRELVGQMLDYAANARVYWPLDRIHTLVVDRYGSEEYADDAVRLPLTGHNISSAHKLVNLVWEVAEELGHRPT